MNDFLESMIGKQIDVSCGTSAVVRGHVVEIGNGLLLLRDEHERLTHVVIDRIAFVWEVKDDGPKAGFVL